MDFVRGPVLQVRRWQNFSSIYAAHILIAATVQFYSTISSSSCGEADDFPSIRNESALEPLVEQLKSALQNQPFNRHIACESPSKLRTHEGLVLAHDGKIHSQNNPKICAMASRGCAGEESSPAVATTLATATEVLPLLHMHSYLLLF